MKIVIKILAPIIVLVVLIQISFLRISFDFAYYALLICAFLVLLIAGKKIRMNYLSVWLVIAAFISILLNEIPTFFRPYERLIAFLMVMGLVGPLVKNTLLIKFRVKLFKTINIVVVGLVVLSFLGIAAGIPMMVGRGGYAGFFNHSMMLGPMASVAMLVAIHQADIPEKKKRRWIFLGIAALAFITCLSAGSRSALLAGITGSLFYYYKTNKGNIKRLIKILILIAAIGLLSFPLWKPYTEGIMSKMAYAEQQGDALVTRAFLWEVRLQEFWSSPFIGVGFASVDTSISIKYDTTEGRVEPGSSWLAVLSMTGLLGFIPLLLLILQYIRFLLKAENNHLQAAFLGGMLFFFVVHMIAEGYVLSAGSGLFFYFWLTLGNIEIFRTQIQNNS